MEIPSLRVQVTMGPRRPEGRGREDKTKTEAGLYDGMRVSKAFDRDKNNLLNTSGPHLGLKPPRGLNI